MNKHTVRFVLGMLTAVFICAYTASAQTGNYCVVNKTESTIYWKDGAWYSGDRDAGGTHCVATDHNAWITVYSKPEGDDTELGPLWVSQNNGCVVVFGRWNWRIKQGLTREQCTSLAEKTSE